MSLEQPLLNTYLSLNQSFTHGQGMWLWDAQGTQYLDSLSGIAVTGLGHNHPVITQTIQKQASQLLHVSNLFQIPEQIALARELVKYSGLSAGFFCNSGAEAVESLIKFARLHNTKTHQYPDPKLIVFSGAFHGRTMGALSACSNPNYKRDFVPLLSGFLNCPFNDIPAIHALADQHSDIIGILIEPIQGEGGVYVPDPNYLNQLSEICTQKNWLLLVDEIQTGMGRTGKLFAYQHANPKILPDAISIAKGLANGIPIGAMFLHEKYKDYFQPGSHGTTFGGNPLACAVGLATLKTIVDNKLPENAAQEGDYILKNLKTRLKKYSQIKNIRGQGLMIGIELDRPCRDILPIALSERIVFNIAGQNVVRLLPPLIITRTESNELIERLEKTIARYLSK